MTDLGKNRIHSTAKRCLEERELKRIDLIFLEGGGGMAAPGPTPPSLDTSSLIDAWETV